MARQARKRGAPRQPAASSEAEARARLRDAFVTALAADYEANGAAAIAVLRAERPHDYVKLVASLLPKDGGNAGEGEEDVPVAIEVRFVGGCEG